MVDGSLARQEHRTTGAARVLVPGQRGVRCRRPVTAGSHLRQMSRPVADRLEAMILVEVNDFNVAVRSEHDDELLSSLRNKFKFGKWLRNEADFSTDAE